MRVKDLADQGRDLLEVTQSGDDFQFPFVRRQEMMDLSTQGRQAAAEARRCLGVVQRSLRSMAASRSRASREEILAMQRAISDAEMVFLTLDKEKDCARTESPVGDLRTANLRQRMRLPPAMRPAASPEEAKASPQTTLSPEISLTSPATDRSVSPRAVEPQQSILSAPVRDSFDIKATDDSDVAAAAAAVPLSFTELQDMLKSSPSTRTLSVATCGLSVDSMTSIDHEVPSMEEKSVLASTWRSTERQVINAQTTSMTMAFMSAKSEEDHFSHLLDDHVSAQGSVGSAESLSGLANGRRTRRFQNVAPPMVEDIEVDDFVSTIPPAYRTRRLLLSTPKTEESPGGESDGKNVFERETGYFSSEAMLSYDASTLDDHNNRLSDAHNRLSDQEVAAPLRKARFDRCPVPEAIAEASVVPTRPQEPPPRVVGPRSRRIICCPKDAWDQSSDVTNRAPSFANPVMGRASDSRDTVQSQEGTLGEGECRRLTHQTVSYQAGTDSSSTDTDLPDMVPVERAVT